MTEMDREVDGLRKQLTDQIGRKRETRRFLVAKADRARAVLWQMAAAADDHLRTNHGGQHTPQAGPPMGESIRNLRRAVSMAQEELGIARNRRRIAEHPKAPAMPSSKKVAS